MSVKNDHPRDVALRSRAFEFDRLCALVLVRLALGNLKAHPCPSLWLLGVTLLNSTK